jgi:hypothetical protein
VTEPDALQKCRQKLFEHIAEAANEIADIDRKIVILQSQELEADLLQAEKQGARA